MSGKQLSGVGNTISKTTSNELDLVLDDLTTNAITVNNSIICSNSSVNSELQCNDIIATGEVHIANGFVNCVEMILPIAAPTVMSVAEGSCYYNDTTGNLLISKDGSTFQTPTLECVTAQPAVSRTSRYDLFRYSKQPVIHLQRYALARCRISHTSTIISKHITSHHVRIFFYSGHYFFPIVVTIKKKQTLNEHDTTLPVSE